MYYVANATVHRICDLRQLYDDVASKYIIRRICGNLYLKVFHMTHHSSFCMPTMHRQSWKLNLLELYSSVPSLDLVSVSKFVARWSTR